MLSERLPAYMVPAYLEQLDGIPMTTNGKADRENLPAPTQRGLRVTRDAVEPVTATEQVLAELMARNRGRRPCVGRQPLLRRSRRQLAA